MTVGLASSFLAVAGMVRAAERIDPLTQALGNQINVVSDERPGESCGLPCGYSPDRAQE